MFEFIGEGGPLRLKQNTVLGVFLFWPHCHGNFGGGNLMGQRIIMTLVTIVLLVGAASFAIPSGIPDVTECTAEMPFAPPNSEVVLFNVPDGTGSPFTEARILEGPVDATIWLTVRDGLGVGIANYPAEDIWLEVPGMLSPCTEGTIPDFNTDVYGSTQWENPLQAGGWTEGQTFVLINGNALEPGFQNESILRHNSPDINGDLQVNLVDLAIFSIDYTGDYSFRSDFHFDGIIGLQDLAKFSIAYNASCP